MLEARVHKDKLVAKWDPRVGTTLSLKPVTIEGKPLAVIPHGEAETKVLRNLGYEVPAPILSQYNWPGHLPPFESQKITAAMLTMESRAYCLSSMGVGKTRAVIYAFDFLRSQRRIAPMLVVAPLSTLVDVWEREVFENFHHLRTVVVHGTKKQRIKLLNTAADMYIINHDGVGVVFNELMAMNFGVVTIDEIGAYRNSQSERWKILNKLLTTKNLPCWGLTGSPTPNAPTDAYGISKLVTPWNVPRSFKRFQQNTMTQLTQFKWVPRPDAIQQVANVLKPSVRFALDECHDLPPVTYSMRHVEMTPKQRELYGLLSDRLKAEYKQNKITAVNEGAKLQKLLQVSAGFVYSKDRGLYVDAAPRMKLVLDLIEEASKKVLVFASYTWLVHALKEVVGSRFSVAEITGEVSKGKRDEIFASFRKSSDPHVIVADARTMAHGLTLVQADMIIWYGPPISAEVHEQANARIRRPGQDSKTHVVYIESTSVEKRAFQRLQRQKRLQGLLLEELQGEHVE